MIQEFESNIKIFKIAIFRALYLGDMLCIIPTVRALRNAYPQASITLVGLSWQTDFAKRFENYFDNFIEFAGWPGLPEQSIDQKKILSCLDLIREQKFDLVLQMQGNGILTNSMCMLWNAKIVAGLRKHNEYCFDENLFPVSEDDDHEVLRFLKLTEALNIKERNTHLEFPILKTEKEKFNIIAKKSALIDKPYICIHPGARDKRRRWSIDNFAFVANHLAAKGYTIVLTGSAEEKSLLNDLANEIKYPVINIVDQFGHIGIGELACLIQQSILLLSNDTGVSHIASALNVPSVIIFSAFSNQKRWAPLNAKLHKAISFEQAKDPEYVLHTAIDHLEKQYVKSPVSFR
jgi:ADP-heptose:LPS heptosyltransferase